MRTFFTLITLLFCFQFAFAHQPATAFSFEFIQNKGQWQKPVLYSTELPQGWLFLEKDRFTYNFLEPAYFNLEHEEEHPESAHYQGHAFQLQFVNANPAVKVITRQKTPGYRNYFIGNDPKKWATEVNAFKEVVYQEVFSKIDLHLYTTHNTLKYDYIVAPQGDVSAIKMKYEGVESLSLKDGRLLIKTSINEIMEERPYAYQVINGIKKEVNCIFSLENKVVGFQILENYNPRLPLIIDPEIVFVSYTGTTNGISANCATADAFSNTYSSGGLLGSQYPVTSGAYQTTRQGSNVAISKFNPDGTKLLYATFLGGSLQEYPLAMVVNKQDELVIAGFTRSVNFPTTASAFDKTLNTTGSLSQDYFIAKLSGDGKNLVASTYLGGDGMESGGTSSEPAALTLDPAGNILFGGATPAANFPIVNGFQKTLKSTAKDGVIVKFNSTLSAIIWSSYIGGSGMDIISDIKVGLTTGKIYISGNTFSSDLPVQTNVVNPKLKGGREGFVAVISIPNNQLEACTYLGTGQSDYAQLLALDAAENVYVAGYTAGTYIITPGAYGTVGAIGGYFIHKLNNSLTSTFFSTQIGSNNVSGGGDFIPTAFQVDDCENIYFTAYAVMNVPLTPDAFEKTRRSLYLGQLSKDAKGLTFGTYFGSSQFSHIHFANHGLITKKGVFHNIECSSSKTFTATPGAFSAGATTSNDGIISKFHFLPTHLVRAQVETPKNICYASPIRFTNKSINGASYIWNFGDGTAESTEVNPVHLYQKPGTYQVRLVANNPANCHKTDTTHLEVSVLLKPGAVLPQNAPYLCTESLVLDAGNPGLSFKWNTGATSQTITITKPGTYEVEVYNGECSILDKITVSAPLPPVPVPNIFTPNKDGKNDFLVIQNTSLGTKLKVFNRWGKLVYQDDSYNNNWDAKNLTQGTYFYRVECPSSCTVQKGWFDITI